MKNVFSILTFIIGMQWGLCGFAAYVESDLQNALTTLSGQDEVRVVVQLSSSLYSFSKESNREQVILQLKEVTKKKLSSLNHSFGTQSSSTVFWILPGFVLNLKKWQVHQLQKDPSIASLSLANKKLRIRSFPSEKVQNNRQSYTYGLEKLKVPEVREKFPTYLGNGIRVGILDTGIAPQHPDLRGKILRFKNFSPAKDPGPADGFGHGTHVAGTIVGGNASREAIGVAPEAQLIVARIFSSSGESDRESILKAMQWMADPDEDPATEDFAQVINNSWSDDEPYSDRDPDQEPFCQIIQNWNHLGMIGVFSAGNTGPSVGTINIPGGCPQAVAVGATERNDRSPHFSSTGPAVWKSYSLMKPEVSAPGFEVRSASSRGGYEEMSGTSMAAPHVTGAIAILLQAFPQKKWNEIQDLLMAGANDLGQQGQDAVFGWGRINLLRSIEKGNSGQK